MASEKIKKEEFIKIYNENGSVKTADYFNLSVPTVLCYAKKLNLHIDKRGRKTRLDI